MISVVVAVQPPLDALKELTTIVGGVQVDVLVLKRTPKALNVDVD